MKQSSLDSFNFFLFVYSESSVRKKNHQSNHLERERERKRSLAFFYFYYFFFFSIWMQSNVSTLTTSHFNHQKRMQTFQFNLFNSNVLLEAFQKCNRWTSARLEVVQVRNEFFCIVLCVCVCARAFFPLDEMGTSERSRLINSHAIWMQMRCAFNLQITNNKPFDVVVICCMFLKSYIHIENGILS